MYNVILASRKGGKNMSEKTQGEELKERLFNHKKNGWENVSEEEGRKIFEYSKILWRYTNGYTKNNRNK